MAILDTNVVVVDFSDVVDMLNGVFVDIEVEIDSVCTYDYTWFSFCWWYEFYSSLMMCDPMVFSNWNWL